MDRATFLAAAHAAVPQLEKVRLPGFPGPVYMRRMAVAEARQLAADAKAEKDAVEAGGSEKHLGDARVLASMVRDEKGELLFDRQDDALMEDLQAAIDAMDAGIIQALLQATNNLNEPKAADEVDASGN